MKNNLELELMLLCAIAEYGEKGLLPLSCIRETAASILAAGGEFSISAMSPDGDTLILEGKIGPHEA